MANEDEKYEREAIKEKIKIDRDNFDLDTVATICTMIQETLHKEGVRFTEVIERLAKTYMKEFTMGDFGVCLAVSDGINDEPIISLVTGSISATLKNLKFMSQGVRGMLNDKETD